MRRGVALIVACLSLVPLAACGGEGDGATPPTSSAGGTLDAVVKEFGRAYAVGDTKKLVALLSPEVQASMTEQERALLEATAQSGTDVELRDFGYEIVRQDASSAEVRYSGTRCAPTVSNSFPESTIAGGPDAVGGSPGTAVEGKVECRDIAETLAERPPVKFTRSDGRWYGNLPAL